VITLPVAVFVPLVLCSDDGLVTDEEAVDAIVVAALCCEVAEEEGADCEDAREAPNPAAPWLPRLPPETSPSSLSCVLLRLLLLVLLLLLLLLLPAPLLLLLLLLLLLWVTRIC